MSFARQDYFLGPSTWRFWHILPNVNQKSNNIISSIGFPAAVAVLSEVSVLKQSFYSPRIFWSAILFHVSTSRSDFKEKFQKVLKGYSK